MAGEPNARLRSSHLNGRWEGSAAENHRRESTTTSVGAGAGARPGSRLVTMLNEMRSQLAVFILLVVALSMGAHGDARGDEPAAGATPPIVSSAPTEPAAPVAPTMAEVPTMATPSVLEPGPAGTPTNTGHKRGSSRGRPGGINPCMTPDPGFGLYDGWSRKVSMGQLLAPQKGGVSPSGAFDLIVHFHGHEALRKEFVKSANGIILVAIDLGIGSGAYSSAFASRNVFEHLLDTVKQEMARRSGRANVTIRRLGLSSWSAGYGAVQQILMQPAGKAVDSVVLLDSLHAGYVDGSKNVSPAGLEVFVEFARQAARGKKFMFQSYSSITPPGYAATREVAHFIVGQLGGHLRTTKRADVLGLAMDERFDQGGYHVRGYLGDDKPDHCAHLGLIKDVVKSHLNARWNPPRAFGVKRRIEGGKMSKKGAKSTPKRKRVPTKGGSLPAEKKRKRSP